MEHTDGTFVRRRPDGRLAHSHVLVVGLGGVGAYAAEQICRAGIGHMTIVDADTVNESNINRQLPALHSTLGMPKAEVVARRLLDINPRLKLNVLNEFFARRTDGRGTFGDPVRFCRRRDRFPQSESIPLVSRLSEKYPCRFLNGCRSQDGPVTSQDRGYLEDLQLRIGKAVRKRLRGLGVNKGIPVVFSTEIANPDAVVEVEGEQCKRTTTGTVSYMPAIFRMLLSLICY